MQIKSEWELLKNIKGLIGKKGIISPPGLIESIGDDCAVFRTGGDRLGLITTDISVESVHFRRDISSLRDIGFKAMMGNVSDITAMGGRAKFAFISLGLPEGFQEEEALALYDGMIEAGNMAGVCIAGGDTSGAGEIILNIALYGEVPEEKLILRRGAKPGDTIYVTGAIGDSMAGLEILLSGNTDNMKRFPGLIDKHRRPAARFDILERIIGEFSPTSMIDISDGLLSDLRHICESSGSGFELARDKLPVSGELLEYATAVKPHYEYALGSGEEYELLFTSAKNYTGSTETGRDLITQVGKITQGGYYILQDNKKTEIPITGFDHFRKK